MRIRNYEEFMEDENEWIPAKSKKDKKPIKRIRTEWEDQREEVDRMKGKGKGRRPPIDGYEGV